MRCLVIMLNCYSNNHNIYVVDVKGHLDFLLPILHDTGEKLKTHDGTLNSHESNF